MLPSIVYLCVACLYVENISLDLSIKMDVGKEEAGDRDRHC